MLDGIKRDGALKPYTGLQMTLEYNTTSTNCCHTVISYFMFTCLVYKHFGSSSKIVHWRGFHTGKLQDMYGHLYDKTWNDLPLSITIGSK